MKIVIRGNMEQGFTKTDIVNIYCAFVGQL